MHEEERKELNNLNRETLLLKTEVAEARQKFVKRFADLKARTNRLLKKLKET